MKNINQWKSGANRLMVKNPNGFKTFNLFSSLLDFIHREDWQGACHASTTVLGSLLAVQGVTAEICLGEVCYGTVYFDHSWVEVDGSIYDAAISNTLIEGLYFPPVFRDIDLSSNLPTELKYGVPSGQGYDDNAQLIRGISVTDYMNAFPNHPQGLFGIAKQIGKSAGLQQLTISKLEKCASQITWKERR
jgi:hypothetical protein